MNARSLVVLSSKEKLAIGIAVFSLISWHMPVVGTAHAKADTQDNALVFEIKNTSLADLEKQNIQEAEQESKLALIDKKVTLIQSYLESQNSPLAIYAPYFAAEEDYKTIIAISNSESNMGLHCYYNNCSGIFGGSGLKKYKNYPEWIADFQALIDKRYKGMTLSQMNGVYVQPRSLNWLAASTKVYQDLSTLEQKQLDQNNLQES